MKSLFLGLETTSLEAATAGVGNLLWYAARLTGAVEEVRLPLAAASEAIEHLLSTGPGATALKRTSSLEALQRRADLARCGRQVDDAPAALRRHHPHLMLHAQKRAEHIGSNTAA